MKRLVYLLPLCFFLVIFGYFAIGLNLNPRNIPSTLIDQKIPHFDLPPIKGSKRGLSHKDLYGQVTMINIFGSWCAAWLSEHPSVTVYDNIGEVTAIHGHGGKTEIIMEPDYKRAYGELKSFIDNFDMQTVMKEKLPLDSQTVKLIKEKEKK